MTRLHTINYWRLRHRNNIRTALLTFTITVTIALAGFGAYAGGEYIYKLHSEFIGLRMDNQQAMAMLGGERFTVDGSAYRLIEVKQKELVGGL